MGNTDPVEVFEKAAEEIRSELQRTKERANALRNMACGIGGGASRERVQSSKTPDKIPEVLARIEEQEKKAGRIRKDMMRLITLFDACISTLDRPEERAALSMRHIGQKKHDLIARTLSVSERTEMRIYARARENIKGKVETKEYGELRDFIKRRKVGS